MCGSTCGISQDRRPGPFHRRIAGPAPFTGPAPFINVPDLSDEEIVKELQHTSSRLFAKIGSDDRKVIGCLINYGVEALGPLHACAISAFPWLMQKFVQPKGHLMFLYRDYPSLFF